jgi:hypothetical protein
MWEVIRQQIRIGARRNNHFDACGLGLVVSFLIVVW